MSYRCCCFCRSACPISLAPKLPNPTSRNMSKKEHPTTTSERPFRVQFSAPKLEAKMELPRAPQSSSKSTPQRVAPINVPINVNVPIKVPINVPIKCFGDAKTTSPLTSPLTYPLTYPLSLRFNSVYKPITERLMGTLMNLPFGLPEHVNGYVNGGHPPLTYPLTVWGPILEARTGVQIGLHLGPQMDPIQGAKIGSFLVPQNHAHLNATDQVGTSARKRSMSNLMDALMGLQAHPPR